MVKTICVHAVEERVELENKARGQSAICFIALRTVHKTV